MCAVWPHEADFFRWLLEGHFRGLKGKRRGCFWGRSAGKEGAVFLEVRAADAFGACNL